MKISKRSDRDSVFLMSLGKMLGSFLGGRAKHTKDMQVNVGLLFEQTPENCCFFSKKEIAGTPLLFAHQNIA